MTVSYSLDLRARVIAFVEAGHSRRAAARHFGVSDSFAIKLMQRQTQSGSPAPARQGRPPGTGKLAPYEGFLVQAVETQPDLTMPELAARLLTEQGVRAEEVALVAKHAFAVAQAFHSYYQKPRYSVLHAECEDHRAFRVLVVDAFGRQMDRLSALLGIPVPERM